MITPNVFALGLVLLSDVASAFLLCKCISDSLFLLNKIIFYNFNFILYQRYYEFYYYLWNIIQRLYKEDAVSSLNFRPLKLVDSAIYLGSNILSIENDVNMHIRKV